MIMPRVERPPTIFEIDFKPGAEIHGRRCRWHADIAQISGCVARRNIQGATHGNGEMLKIAADAEAFGVDVQSRLRGPGMLVSEYDSGVDPVANSLHARIAGRHGAK